MVDRPILKFPDPVLSERRTGSPRSMPRPQGPGRQRQGERFQGTFDRLNNALNADNAEVILRSDPAGIAPERALVFVTAGNVQNFAKAAKNIGLEVFVENELEDTDDFPDGFEPPADSEKISRMLYATMPTLTVFQKISSLWNAYQSGESAPTGASPWWAAFDLLIELRPWGPEDRLTESARSVIEDRLPFDDEEEVYIELEIWPAANNEKRKDWREEVEQRVHNLGGRVIDRSSIVERSFIYEALLVGLPAYAVRQMLDNTWDDAGLATVQGVQFVLPQSIGQTLPDNTDHEQEKFTAPDAFNVDSPVRAVLLDGTPVAAHEALDGGVIIEDLNDIVRLSEVNQRYHATEMASLILRGDLDSDGTALKDSRLISVPFLIDSDGGNTRSPENRLLVDLVHSTLLQLVAGEEPLSPDVFVVNFSVGIRDMHFSGRISALARLMDWWAFTHGILFIVSAGNITDPLVLSETSISGFEDSDAEEQRRMFRSARRALAYARTLLTPAEALNVLTVGAVSEDLNGHVPFEQAWIIKIEEDGSGDPQITSACGLGLNRAIKPDLLHSGGCMEVRAFPNGDDLRLNWVAGERRTGLITAAPGNEATKKSKGTSHAVALTTRAILQSVEALTQEGGPYGGLELPRKAFSLLSKALAVNATRWPDGARSLYDEELSILGSRQHARAKAEVCKHYGYGVLSPELMQQSPQNGVTMVGYGSIRKDQAKIFRLPLPPSISGDRVPRSMLVTITWFSPVNPARAQYRLASLEAVSADGIDADVDKKWLLNLKSDGPDSNMVKRGSVWSRRMMHDTKTVPEFDENADIPICVQCRDASNGGLNQDDDIEFAIAVTLEVEAEVQYDLHDEVDQKVRLRLRGNA